MRRKQINIVFLIITILCFYNSRIIGQSDFELEVVFPNEIGYLEPLFLHFNISYKGEGEILAYRPFDVLEVYIGRVEQDMMYQLFEVNTTQISEHQLTPTSIPVNYYETNSTRIRYLPKQLVLNNIGELNSGFTLTPGYYKIKLVYAPYSFHRKEEFKKQIFIEERLFEVVDYTQSQEKEAVEWLLQQPNPLLLYIPKLNHRTKDDYLKTIIELESFLNRFPDSRFAPFGHYNLTLLLHLKADRIIRANGYVFDGIEQEIIPIYEDIESHYHQFVETSNPESVIYDSSIKERYYKAKTRLKYLKRELQKD